MRASTGLMDEHSGHDSATASACCCDARYGGLPVAMPMITGMIFSSFFGADYEKDTRER